MHQRRQDLRADQHVLLDVLVLVVAQRARACSGSPRGSRSCRCRAAGRRCGWPRSPRRRQPRCAATLAERSATRAECPRRYGSLASSAFTSASSVATEIRSWCGLLQPPLRHPERDLLLEPLVDLLAFEAGVPPLERAWDGAAEVGQVDRLDEVVECAALHAERGDWSRR